MVGVPILPLHLAMTAKVRGVPQCPLACLQILLIVGTIIFIRIAGMIDIQRGTGSDHKKKKNQCLYIYIGEVDHVFAFQLARVVCALYTWILRGSVFLQRKNS
jgi:hypothetical protein